MIAGDAFEKLKTGDVVWHITSRGVTKCKVTKANGDRFAAGGGFDVRRGNTAGWFIREDDALSSYISQCRTGHDVARARVRSAAEKADTLWAKMLAAEKRLAEIGGVP